MKNLTVAIEMVETILEALKSQAGQVPAPEETKSKTGVKAISPKKEKVEEEEAEDVAVEAVEVNLEDLKDKSYNEIKQIAKDLGIEPKGSRKVLEEKIKEALAGGVTSEAEEEEEKEEVVEDKPKGKISKFPTKKKEEAEPVEEDPLMTTILEQTEDMTDEELADMLSEVGIKPSGKRQALLDKIVQAIHDGLIEMDGEEEASEEVEEEEVPYEEFAVNVKGAEGMTRKRAEAVVKIGKAKMTDKEAGAFLDELVETIGEDNFALILDGKQGTDVEIAKSIKMLLTNDDGEEVGFEEAYELNGEAYCCTLPLDYDKKTKTYTCQLCEQEYEG